MASFDSKLLNTLARKLGVDSENVLKKASELLRLLQLKVTASSGIRQLSDTSRVVMCIDLACNTVGFPFDKSDVLRLAGVNKKQYSNGLHLVEKLLDLSKPITVKTLCVQLGVSEVTSSAEKILDKYVELHSGGPNGCRPLDSNLPVYHCVAVFMACKFMKVKVDRNKLVEASRIKKVQFDKLIEDFSPALECMGSREVKKSATKRSHKLIELVDKYDEEKYQSENSTTDKEITNADEDFESWKKRILSEANEDAN